MLCAEIAGNYADADSEKFEQKSKGGIKNIPQKASHIGPVPSLSLESLFLDEYLF